MGAGASKGPLVAGVAAIVATIAVVLLTVAGVTGRIASDLCQPIAEAVDVGPVTAQAKREIPSRSDGHSISIATYKRLGDKLDIDWHFVASIGSQESNHGRSAAARAVNYAGCQGPMQLGVGGACGDFFGSYKTDGDGDGKISPLDPEDAVATAINGLKKGKGAPGKGGSYQQYRQAACGYYGACADGLVNYADEVMARAVGYGFNGPGTPEEGGIQEQVEQNAAPPPAATEGDTGGQGCSGGSDEEVDVKTVPGRKAVILPSGEAAAPEEAPAAVKQMIAAGNRINKYPYSWGGAHGAPAQTMNQKKPNPEAAPGEGENGGPGYDCSSSTSYVIWADPKARSVLGGQVHVSGSLAGLGQAGKGEWVTWYANGSHVYIEVAGIFFDTAGGKGRKPRPPNTGPRWTPDNYGPEGFTLRHPPGL